MSPAPHILVAGSYGLSTRYVVGAAPEPGETIIAAAAFVDHGGKGSNQAIAAARLGARVDFITAIGEDAAGDGARALWRAEGVRCTVRRTSEVGTMTGAIIVEADGENRIVVGLGAMDTLDDRDADIVGELANADTTVIVQNEAPLAFTRRVLELARAVGARTVYNPAPAVELPSGTDLWAFVDYLVPNATEARALLGDTAVADDAVAGELARRTGCRVVLTLGALGAMIAGQDGGVHVPAVETEVVDTTGAGDCFTAAFATAMARGKGEVEAVGFACQAAARAVSAPGVLDGLPYAADLR